MLIKVTNKCSVGCNHCQENSTPAGEHMREEIFLAALDLTRRLEVDAYAAGLPPHVLLSGGECTEHPDFVKFLEIVVQQGFFPILITNGMWLGNKELREQILRPEWPHMFVQVTNDPRFYPTAPPTWDDSRVKFVPELSLLIPLGRAAGKPKLLQLGVPQKKAPASFNFRSMTRSLGSVTQAIAMLRARSVAGLAGWCTPSISADGTLVAGESNLCFGVGNVLSTADEVTKAVMEMRCNKCTLVDNLTPEQKRAIGESVLYGVNE